MDTGGWVDVPELMKAAEQHCEAFRRIKPSAFYARRGPSGSSGSATVSSLPHNNTPSGKKEYLFQACLARAAMEAMGGGKGGRTRWPQGAFYHRCQYAREN